MAGPQQVEPGDLIAAATWGEVSFLESCLQNGTEPDQRDQQGNTPLHVACYYGELECASVLLSHKANVNAIGAEGKTPLHQAVAGVLALVPGPKFASVDRIKDNQMDLVKLLVTRGGDMSIRDKTGNTPRDFAIQCDFYECVELLDELTRINEEEEKRRVVVERVNAMYTACADGDVQELAKLLSVGPDAVNHCLKDGLTLLMLAARKGHLSVIQLLMEKKPSIIFDKTLRTALHYAAESGHVDIVRYLIQRMPRLLEFDESQEGSSLHLAARNGHLDVVKFFLGLASLSEGQRAPCKPRNEGVTDSTSLDKPVDERSIEEFIDVMVQSPKDAKTPLHEAAINGHVEVVRAFVEYLQQFPYQKRQFHSPSGSSPSPSPAPAPTTPSTPRVFSRTPTPATNLGIDMMTTRGLTPLHEAARRGHKQVIEILLDAGADINSIMRPAIDVTVNAELTALVEAGMSNKIDMVRFLLQKGATDSRLKALHRVIRPAYNDIAGVLLSHNGAVTVDSGCMELKKRKGDPDSASVLLLSVSWAGKKLPYIHPSWLEATIIEAPRPKADHCAISLLNVSENKLQELPIQLFQLKHLHHLDISRNSISTLPVAETKDDEGWECHNLEYFDLGKNQLTSLPGVLFKLPHLRELNACHNRIQEVAMCIWLAPSLKKLYLQNNLLTSFPSPLSRHDSGISTWEPSGEEGTDSQAMTSFSPPIIPESSLPPSLLTPPSRLAVTSVTRRPNSNLLQQRRNRLQTSPVHEVLADSTGGEQRRVSFPIISNHSRLLDIFAENSLEPNIFDEGEDFDAVFGSEEKAEHFSLEVLDISNNKLVEVPVGLSCLAPKLLKLIMHHNHLVSLGSVSDYPTELELLDAGYNQLTTAIAFNLQRDELRSVPCAQKLLLLHPRNSVSSISCSHRSNGVLKKLSYLRLNNNQLKDVQLFHERWWKRRELGMSIDETNLRKRTQSSGERHRLEVARQGFHKSAMEVPFLSPFGTDKKRSPKESISEDSSDEGSSSSSGKHTLSQDVQGQTYCVFPSLSSLDVANNLLTSVPAYIYRVPTLSVLVISHNPGIDTLPLELSTLENLWSLEYKGVPLVNPSYQDLDKFHSVTDKLQFMRSLLHNAKPYESMKLMLVGLQAQGKTSLLAKLREVNEDRFMPSTFSSRVKGEKNELPKQHKRGEPPLSTVGVDVGLWKYRKDLEPSNKKKGGKMKSVTFYTWDFGGQEEYYVTHQCFLSSRALYLVIFNVTDGKKGVKDLGPWLLNIQARAPGSPVVIVGTHLDKIKGDLEKERRKQEVIAFIQEKYPFEGNTQHLKELGLPNIKDVLFVGCPSNGRSEGVSELRQALYDIAFSLTVPQRRGMGSGKAKLLEQNIPASYLKLEKRVREIAVRCQQDDSPPVIKDVQFRELTNDIISNSRELNQAATFLHENGVMLHYDTPALSHLFFVDPQWLCDMLAHIVTVPEVNNFINRGTDKLKGEPGILRITVLSHVFRGRLFPQQYKNEYVELLEKFEVAIQLDRVRLLIPSMLSTRPLYTIHRFKNVFPRPPLSLVLQQATQHENQSASIDSSKDIALQSNPSVPSSGEKFLLLDNLIPDPMHPIPSSSPLHCTGLLLRRFYFMTYVPSGFWARLISRFLTCSDIPRTVLTHIGFPSEQIEHMIAQLISGTVITWVSLEWSYWKTGIELWYQGYSLLRVAEIIPGGSFPSCKPCPFGFKSSSSSSCSSIEPSIDSEDLSFQLGGHWMPVEMTPNSGIEILIPDYVCLSLFQKRNSQRSSTSTTHSAMDDPQQFLYETAWMSAQLLAIVVHLIDSLLEEWYTGISFREGLRIGIDHVIPYINRIVPCPVCVSNAEPLSADFFKVWSDVLTDDLLDTEEEHFAHSPHSSSVDKKKGPKRSLLPVLNKSTMALSPPALDSEGCISRSLVRATKFGFMLDRCLAALSGLEPLICPAHPDLNLTVGDIAPDLVFADLPRHFIISEDCLHQGKFVAEGAFGKIYQGILYPHPSATDDEGREVAIKVGKQEKHSSGPEALIKSYAEVRVEVTVLKRLHHEHIIEFLGVRLQPLGFLIEWAPLGGLHSILKSYYKADARISPWALCETARQVASGVAYLHENNIVYYDLKSPNVLVFMFPSPSESIACSLGHSRVSPTDIRVLVKVSDMGISQMLAPGGVMGFKGTHGFMAPEILLYKGHEAYTEKVDIFSFSMFMYELISLQCPFERQNFMSTQIDKMVAEGERPPLQYREMNNPILYLDIMRWAWQQNFHQRPSAAQLEQILSKPTIPLLVDAFNLQPYCDSTITASCTVTLPIDISTSSEGVPLSPPVKHAYMTQGDVQEEVWLCSYVEPEVTGVPEAGLSIISFRGRANFSVDPVEVGSHAVTSICCVNNGLNNTVWLGSENGMLMIFDAMTHTPQYSRQVSLSSRSQGVISISHVTGIHQVLLVRSDGTLLLFDESISEQKMTDVRGFDNRVNDTFLPVKSVLKTPERNASLLCAQLVCVRGSDCASVWCGSLNEFVYAIDVGQSLVHHCRRLKHRDLSVTSVVDKVRAMAVMERDKRVFLWTLTHPHGRIYLWDCKKETILTSLICQEYTPHDISSLLCMADQLFLGTKEGTIDVLTIDSTNTVTNVYSLSAHTQSVHTLLPLGSRILPRQWLPTLIGRTNVINHPFYAGCIAQEDIDTITERMIGRQQQLLVSIGHGFHGVCGKMVEPLMTQQDLYDTHVLLWLPPR